MENLETRPPRTLPYRFYYKWYAIACAVVWLLCVGVVAMLLLQKGESSVEMKEELYSFSALSLLIPAFYLWWLHPKLTRTVQVFHDHVRVTSGDMNWDISFNDIKKVDRPFFSLMRFRMNDGHSWWFSAALERPDYLWEGLAKQRPELVESPAVYEEFRLKLVQYDHHEKRKEWFFRHRFLDVINWVIVPLVVLVAGYQYQTQDVIIHSKGLYFFRLGMYAMFMTITCAFVWSVLLKKLVFDRMVEKQMESGKKLRDMQKEDQILQRAKFLQLVTCTALMAFVVKTDLNLFSVTKLKSGSSAYQLRSGKTIVVDNRFNCVDCKHALIEGDLILFGRGTLGQVLAMPGEVIAQTRETSLGRSIASETVTEVPEGHIALKTGAEGKDVVLVPISDLVGRLKKP